ncbi:ribonucrease Y [Alkalibacterium putridalgicola]|uniref:Ribonuclease Y n=1 Tax=Alkalibacterium putridalgicola TaxID=426703 RepID=A0A1H7T273_9LACT|nr:ribonuclease Y [Alkalibacterium putridalgicola]GEK89272.1 ribonuclease Y [Alkalibacterium putridalgicola]SEL78334.1 ribonucrease Y [Alkalibacterium putridalgicola]
MDIILSTAAAIVTLIIGLVAGSYFTKQSYEKRLANSKQTAEDIIEDANKEAETLKKEALLEAKEEIHSYRTEIEWELKERRSEVSRQENRIAQREDNMERKETTIDKRESSLQSREDKLSARQKKVEELEQAAKDLLEEQNEKLLSIAGLSEEEAKSVVLKQAEQELTRDMAIMVKRYEDQAKVEADRKAKNIVTQAIQRCAADQVTESTVSVINLPNDDMKGRIIGREGRNIRTLESLTGMDLIIDDTPEAVVLSGYDPIRREVAKMALEKLISDGRIHPGRIEEAVEKSRKEMDERIREIGEEAMFELGIHSIHPDLMKIIGRLHFRTSYGQNVLNHSIEVAKLAGVMAAELGEDVQLAKRAGLLHDIGKALDSEVEGSHVEIGAQIAMKYQENETVINAIASHHGDVDATSVIAVLVESADSISAARPGARSESLEHYLQRLENLERISNSFKGVKESYAIQAGREVRIIVKPDELDDSMASKLARDVRKQIEDDMDYPGHIKVTVIRETRAVEYAK